MMLIQEVLEELGKYEGEAKVVQEYWLKALQELGGET